MLEFKEKRRMGNSYFLVVLGIVLAKGLGFYRDMVFAGTFGTGVMADIYFQVYGLVNLIFTGIGVALSTLIIKNLNKAENVGQEKAYAARFLQKSAGFLVLAAGLMAIFARQIVGIILPEISGEALSVAVKLTYIMLPSLVFVVIAYIISGVLQNEKVYFITAIMSLPFNVAIIASLFIPGVSVLTVGAVTTVGWFLHIAILLPAFYKKGYKLLARDAYVQNKKEKSPEILWIFVSNMMFQLCFYTDRAFVSGNPGMAATFNYASNLFITVSSVFVVAMSTVVFPSISKNYEEGHMQYVNSLLQYILTSMAAIFLPFLLSVGFFGKDIIRLLYERGSFTPEATLSVSVIFLVYSLGILGYVSQELFNKVLYLAGKYKYSVIGTAAVVFLNVLVNVFIRAFVPEVPFYETGLTAPAFFTAATSSVFLTGYAVLVAVGIRRVVGPYFTKSLRITLGKIFLAGGLACSTYFVCRALLPSLVHGYITFLLPLGACGAVYLFALYKLGVLKQLMQKEKRENAE